MEISINQSLSFGMKPIRSLRNHALRHSAKVKKTDPNKLKKANENIEAALKGSKIERYKAEESASEAILTK